MIKCERCDGVGWMWDKNAAKSVRENGRWIVKLGRKWKHCGWCMGTGEIDEWQCDSCGGCGMKSDDSYSTFGCPWCDSKGCKKGAPKGWKYRSWEPKKPNPSKRKSKTTAEVGDGSRWDEL